MSTGSELKAFVSSFKTGWDMVAESQKDKQNLALKNEEIQLRRAANDRQAVESAARLEWYGAGKTNRELANEKLRMQMKGTYPAPQSNSSSTPGALDLTPLEGVEGLSHGGLVGNYAMGGAAIDPEYGSMMSKGVTFDSNNPNSAGVPGMDYVGERPPSPPPQADTPDAMPDKTPKAPAGFSWNSAYSATKVGLEQAAKKAGLLTDSAVETPEQKKGVRSFVEGAGAADPKLRKEAEAAVDPKGTMSPSTRNMAVLAHAFDFYNKRGQPDKAANVAEQLVQSMRQEANTLFSIAHAAAEEGDIDGATKAWLRAYASVPDGLEISAQMTPDGRLAVRRIDEQTGAIVDKMVLTPEERLRIITDRGIGNFDQIIMSAEQSRQAGVSDTYANYALGDGATGGAGGTGSAGSAGALPAGSPVAKPDLANMKPGEQKDAIKLYNARTKTASAATPKFADRAKVNDAVRAAWSAAFTDNEGNPVESNIPKKDQVALTGIASRLAQTNDVTPEEAVNAVQAVVYVDPNDPTGIKGGKLGFSFKSPEDYKNGKVIVDGREVQFPPEQFRQLVAMRDRQVQAIQAENDKTKKKSDQRALNVSNVLRDAKNAVYDESMANVKTPAEGAARMRQQALRGFHDFANPKDFVSFGKGVKRRAGKALDTAKGNIKAVEDWWSQFSGGK